MEGTNELILDLKMKKFIFGMLFVPVLMGCDKGEEDFAKPVHAPREYAVSVGFQEKTTDIDESPFTRIGSDSDLYGIRVYSAPLSSTEEDDYKAYAYGLFDTKVGITLRLLDGCKYKFVSTMIVDGKSKIYYDSYNKCYYYPFALYTESAESCSIEITNRFIVSTHKLHPLGCGFADIINSDCSTKSLNLSDTDYYDGETVEYIPSENGVFLLIEII